MGHESWVRRKTNGDNAVWLYDGLSIALCLVLFFGAANSQMVSVFFLCFSQHFGVSYRVHIILYFDLLYIFN